jgi:hypothetical protein
LKHHDDRGDHILVDNHFNITAIIDWEYASIEVRDFAFSSHCMMWPVADFYNGKNNLSCEEIEFASISESVDAAIWLTFFSKDANGSDSLFSVSENMSSDPQEFQNLSQGLRAALLDECEPEKLEPYGGPKRSRSMRAPTNSRRDWSMKISPVLQCRIDQCLSLTPWPAYH